MPRRVALALFILLVAGLAGVRALVARPRPSVLIVTLDTLRADAAGRRHGTPAIAAFLERATHFRRARTVAPLTLPAHVSLFSGVDPTEHGVHDNVAAAVPPAAARPFRLLAEEFRDAGYATAAFVARPVLAARSGLDAGFQTYECPPAVGDDDPTYLPAEERVVAATAWLRARREPFFAWVHLFDPHAPYRPFAGDARRAASQAGEKNARLYAGEARRVDAAVEKLLAAIGEETIVVLVSDHGEGLGEHGEPTHGPLCYGATLDLFLAVRAPGLPEGGVDFGLRSICDVAPTLRALCRLPAAPQSGRPLTGPPHAMVVSESLYTFRIHGWGQAFAASDGRFTLVESGPRLELFDRRYDPGEVKPLPLALEAYERLDRALQRYRSRSAGAAPDETLLGSVPPYGKLRRRESRYLQRHENARLLDPRTHLPTWARMEALRQAIGIAAARREAGTLRAVLGETDRLVEITPGSPRLHHYRALAFAALGRLTGERKCFSRAAEAELAAIERGYLVSETVRAAVDYGLLAGEAGPFRTLLRRVARSRFRPAPGDMGRLEAAAVRLGVAGEEAVRRHLDRIARRGARQPSRASRS